MYSNIDFLIVGSGIYGATIARLLTDSGHKCLMVDRRDIIGGNCSDTLDESNSYYINIFGPHIFHTSDNEVKDFVTTYSEFKNYDHTVMAVDQNRKLYTLPINLHTLYEIYEISDVKEMIDRLTKECKEAEEIYKDRNDFEATACKKVGRTVYETILKEYTEKQWGKECKDVPGNLIERLNIDFSFSTKYYNDTFVGLPVEGYTKMISNIIEGTSTNNESHSPINCIVNIDVLSNKEFWFKIPRIAVIYCGAVDELMEYELGELEWRSLQFDFGEYEYDGKNGQGIGVMNYIFKEANHTRITDYTYFNRENIDKDKLPIKGVVSIETPIEWKRDIEPFYPINTEQNNELYFKYLKLVDEKHKNVFLGGRLGKYKYLDMDDAVAEAIKDFKYIYSTIHNEGSTEQ